MPDFRKSRPEFGPTPVMITPKTGDENPSFSEVRASDQSVEKRKPEQVAGGYFVQVPVELLKGDYCSPAALKLYLILLSYCGRGNTAWPGQERLASDMGLTERRVRSLLDELEKAGLVAIDHRAGNKTNLYEVKKFRLIVGSKESRTLALDQKLNKNFQQDRKNSSDKPTQERNYFSGESHEANHESESDESHSVVASASKESPGSDRQPAREVASYKSIRSSGGINPPWQQSSTSQVIETGESAVRPPNFPAGSQAGFVTRQRFQSLFEKAGIWQGVATGLAAVLVANKRDEKYLVALLNWLERQPHITNKGAYLATLIKQNVELPVSQTIPDKGSNNYSLAVANPKNRSSLDLSKFAPGGKYAYLVRQA